MDVTVAVATFGSFRWHDLAHERAIPSVRDEAPVVSGHYRDLATGRNRLLEEISTEYVIYLDADDELEPGYVEAMAAGEADIRAPSVRYVRGRGRSNARVPRVVGHDHACGGDCLPEGNFIAIGAAARTELIREVGGWREWPAWEDWDLWLRCHLAGASIETVPEAIYRAHMSAGSRNTGFDQRFADKLHAEILEANLPRAAA